MAEKPVFDIKVNPDDARLAQAWFNKLEDLIAHPRMNQALINGAVILEGSAKDELNELVYSTPEASGYKRTRKLMNSTVAQGKLETGVGNIKVEKTSNTLTSGIITHVNYGVHVHMGAGPNRKRGPRPYMSNAAKKSEKDFVNEVKEAINDIAKGGF